MKFSKTIFVALIFLCCATVLQANNPVYEQRRTDYINNALANFNNNAITIQAYMGVPVDSVRLHDVLAGIPTDGTVDFDLVQLVRILFLSTGQYDTIILPVINTLPFQKSLMEANAIERCL